MNIFVLDNDVKKCAQYHCDKHVVKMIIEYAQMLSTAVRLTTDLDIGYKLTHKNHPCTVWARKSLSNWKWLRELSKEVNDEYRYRYDKEVNHKSFDVIQTLPEPNIPDLGLTAFPLAMPEYCMLGDVPNSYRNYYMKEKSNFVSWKKREIPEWYN
jgi:hypothetical protein